MLDSELITQARLEAEVRALRLWAISLWSVVGVAAVGFLVLAVVYAGGAR